MPNVPVKLYLPPDLVQALEDAAKKTGVPTPNAVAVDVIERCLPIWLAAREAFDGVLDDFLQEAVEQARKKRSLRQKK